MIIIAISECYFTILYMQLTGFSINHFVEKKYQFHLDSLYFRNISFFPIFGRSYFYRFLMQDIYAFMQAAILEK